MAKSKEHSLRETVEKQITLIKNQNEARITRLKQDLAVEASTCSSIML